MKLIGIGLFLFLLSTVSFTQSAKTYQADLDRLYEVLKKTPSYRDQVKGAKSNTYERLYHELRQDTTGIQSDYAVFLKLARMFFPIYDNHLGFHQLPVAILEKSKYEDSVAINKYRGTTAFRDYPRIDIDLDSLEGVLSQKPKDSVEGIYYYDRYLKVGLFRAGKEALKGVVLFTSLPHWEKGQVAIHLYEYMPGYFRAIYAHPVYKGFLWYGNEKYRNHSLVNSFFYSSLSETVYRKYHGQVDFINLGKNEPQFAFRQLRDNVQYMRLKNFSARPADVKASQEFYAQVKDSLKAGHLVVDLRNNTGGAYSVSKKFLQLIKRNSKKITVHVLINNGTMSQGEIFTLQLKKIAAVTIYGEPSMGTIAYGSNSDKKAILPSGKFQVAITDMKDKGNYFRYENIGIDPDIALQTDLDWVEQVLRRIEKQ